MSSEPTNQRAASEEVHDEREGEAGPIGRHAQGSRDDRTDSGARGGRNGKNGGTGKNNKENGRNGNRSARADNNLQATEQADKVDKRRSISKSNFQLSAEDLQIVNSRSGLIQLLRSKNIRLKDVMSTLRYENEMIYLQIELVKLQRWVTDNGKRVAILFEGRDAAGKGGAIRRFTEHMNPRSLRVVALPKPSEEERGQWYFQRYSRYLPNEGEIVFFDRSWYNRAVVEPVNGFCTESEYLRFMQQVPEWEHMLYEDGLSIIKFWFSISKEEQERRFQARRHNPLKQWKLSPIDEQAQALWNDYTHYKEEMFSKTHTSFSPWIIVKANNKKLARLESIRYVLDHIPYAGKENAKVRISPDPNIVTRYHRNANKLD